MADVTIRKMRKRLIARKQCGSSSVGAWRRVLATPDVPYPERSSLDVEHARLSLRHGDTLIGVASYILHETGFAETASLAVEPGWVGRGVGELAARGAAGRIEISRRRARSIRGRSPRGQFDWYMRKFGYRIVGLALGKGTSSDAGTSIIGPYSSLTWAHWSPVAPAHRRRASKFLTVIHIDPRPQRNC